MKMLAMLALAVSLPAFAEDGALSGMKEGKMVYDITEGDGKLLLGRIETIEETRQDLLKQGVTPKLVISFRGGATKLVQSDMQQVKEEDRPVAAKIQAMLQQMAKAPGMQSIEQCAVAIRHAGTKAENVIPPIKVVANSYITLMAYQAHGYAYIRP